MKKVIIGAVVLLEVIGAGLYFYNKNTVKTHEGKGTLSKLDETTISKIVDDFYQKYESCLKNTPSEANGKVGEYCQNNTGVSSANFAANLEKGGVAKAGADPIFCAQNPPESIKASSDFRLHGDTATGYADEKFGSSQIKTQIDFVNDSGVLKIDNIVCPKP